MPAHLDYPPCPQCTIGTSVDRLPLHSKRVVRPEHPEDVETVRHVNVMAFGTEAEADLVDVLRKAGAVTLSAVAVLGAARTG